MKIRELISQIKQRMDTDFKQSIAPDAQLLEQEAILQALKKLSHIYAESDAEFNLRNPLYQQNMDFTTHWKTMLNGLQGNRFIIQLQNAGQAVLFFALEQMEDQEEQEAENQLREIRASLKSLYFEKKARLLKISDETQRMEVLLQNDIREEEAEIYLDCFEKPDHKNLLLDMFPSLKNQFTNNNNNASNDSFSSLDDLALHLTDMTEEDKLVYVKTIKDENWNTLLQTQESLDFLLACFKDPNAPFLKTLQFNFAHLKATVSQLGLNRIEPALESIAPQSTTQRHYQPGQ